MPELETEAKNPPIGPIVSSLFKSWNRKECQIIQPGENVDTSANIERLNIHQPDMILWEKGGIEKSIVTIEFKREEISSMPFEVTHNLEAKLSPEAKALLEESREIRREVGPVPLKVVDLIREIRE